MSYDELEEAESRVYQIKMKRAHDEMFADLEILYEGYFACGTEMEDDDDSEKWRPCVVDFLVIACGVLEIDPGYKPRHMSEEDWTKECKLMFANAHAAMQSMRGHKINDHACPAPNGRN